MENASQRSSRGEIIGLLAGLRVTFLIDSGAEVNTVDKETFVALKESCPDSIYGLKSGSDKQLKAYALDGEIPVIATFITELFISEDRPRLMEKFYAVDNGRALLGRNTAVRYTAPTRITVSFDFSSLLS